MQTAPLQQPPSLAPDGLEAGRFVREAVRHPILDRLLVASRAEAWSLVASLLVVTFALDVATPVEMSFSLLYLVPVALATWALGRGAGALVATGCSVLIYAWERFGAFPYSSSFFLHWAFFVHLGFYLAFALALGALRSTYLRTKLDTLRDAETGLYNRRAFYEAVAVETRRALRFSRSLSLATFDLGDEMPTAELHRVSAALAASRLYDVAARVDRARFVLLLPETGAEAARIAVERVRHEAGLDTRKDARVGIATFEWPPTCVDDLLREGDRVMQAVSTEPAPCLRHAVHRGTSLTPVPSGRLSQNGRLSSKAT